VSEKKLKIGEYLAKLEARAWLSHALCALVANTQLKDKESDETIKSRSCFKLCQIFTDLKKLTDRLSKIYLS